MGQLGSAKNFQSPGRKALNLGQEGHPDSHQGYWPERHERFLGSLFFNISVLQAIPHTCHAATLGILDSS